MMATIINFAICMPGWESLDSVRRIHTWLEGTALAFFALLVVFDVLAHLYEKKSEHRAHWFGTIGLWFFAIAVLSEIAAYKYGQRNDTLSGQVIGSLDTKVGKAAQKAEKALIDSDAALSNSREALNAQRELDQLKAPRALVNSKGLTVKLSKYKGTEYTINVFPDDESIQLAKTLDIALHESGWNRKQVVAPGAPTTNTFGDGPNDQTNLCLERGIVVHMAGGASPELIVATSKRNVRELPKNLQIGVALCSILPSHIDPPDARNVGKDVKLAGGKSLDDPMQICVGQKPNSFTPKKAQSSAKPTHDDGAVMGGAPGVSARANCGSLRYAKR